LDQSQARLPSKIIKDENTLQSLAKCLSRSQIKIRADGEPHSLDYHKLVSYFQITDRVLVI